jgi:hypothetical protein
MEIKRSGSASTLPNRRHALLGAPSDSPTCRPSSSSVRQPLSRGFRPRPFFLAGLRIDSSVCSTRSSGKCHHARATSMNEESTVPEVPLWYVEPYEILGFIRDFHSDECTPPRVASLYKNNSRQVQEKRLRRSIFHTPQSLSLTASTE